MNDFHETIAGQTALEVSMGLTGRPVDDLDSLDKIILLEQAGRIGKEELIDVIISMLPVDLRMPASDAYDLVCYTH